MKKTKKQDTIKDLGFLANYFFLLLVFFTMCKVSENSRWY